MKNTQQTKNIKQDSWQYSEEKFPESGGEGTVELGRDHSGNHMQHDLQNNQ